MYTKYFGFNEKPFTLTPNPRFIYLSKNHKEAFAHLLYGINNHYGFIELIGEVGTGKTTVLRTLLSQLKDENYRTGLIFNPCLTGVELLRSINNEFGINAESEYSNELLAELNRFLLAENAGGRTVVLVIDEAQNLRTEVLEQIRLISNLETENDKLIQIILAGQPELESLLGQPELRQLNQRIAVRYRLRSMSSSETFTYIRHRMEVAGETGGVSFNNNAIRWVYFYTRGIPRMINILCDRALLIAYGDERRRISAGVVTRAIREIINFPRGKRLPLACAWIFFAIIILTIIVMSISKWTPIIAPSKVDSVIRKITSSEIGGHKVAPASLPGPVLPESSPGIIKLEQDLSGQDQDETHIHAFNAIVTSWGAYPIKQFNGRLTVPDMFGRLTAKRNLLLTSLTGSLDKAIAFDLPFLVETKIQGKLGAYCIAVTSAGKNGLISVSPALSGSSTITKEELDRISSGRFYLIWQKSGKFSDAFAVGDKSFEVRSLQRLLKQAGFYTKAIDGVYRTETIKAVRDFQQSKGLAVNDTVGDLTMAALMKYETVYQVPSLKKGNKL
ncbi:MAG TPA: AAA family ATPase [Negativicutes bacterium]